MRTSNWAGMRVLALAIVAVLGVASIAQAQDDTNSRVRQVAAGQKVKIKGVIVERNPDSIVVRDTTQVDTIVALNDTTSVKSNGGFFKRGTNYDVTNLLRGLIVEAEGTGNANGELVASKIRFDKQDLKTATALDSRVAPVEDRVGKVEQSNKALAGQVDELSELSKMARDEAAKASSEAARANAGVDAANQRISNLDNFEVKNQVSVLFALNSSKLTPEGQAQLDEIATMAEGMSGYIVEIAGYTDSTGSVAKNQALSQARADAVVRYLTGERAVPLRRIITPTGYGALKPVEDNTTRTGRQANRRVEVNLLVNSGLANNAQAQAPPSN